MPFSFADPAAPSRPLHLLRPDEVAAFVNNDGSLFDPCDIDSFLLVFSEGPCTLCGN